MPPALDLRGRHFGKLTVLREGPTVQFGGPCRSWWCQCSCGSPEFVVPQKRLPYAAYIKRLPGRVVDACAVCRGKPCPVCGQIMPVRESIQYSACPGACMAAWKRKTGRESWHRRFAKDPNLGRKMHARRLEKAAADPEYAAKLLRWEKERRERKRQRMAADPEYAARERARANAFYARNAERIQAERRARLDTLSPAELAKWIDRARRYTRDYRRKYFADIKVHPEKHQKYLDTQAEYRRRRAAIRLGQLCAELQRRLDRGDNTGSADTTSGP